MKLIDANVTKDFLWESVENLSNNVWATSIGIPEDKIDEIIDSIPSAKQWIPCGKELPAEDGMYLATIGVKWSIPRFRWVDRCFFSDGVWLVDQENAKVYAWMKLPHRYEGN